MSQYLLPTIDPSINTGSQLSVWLNLWAAAVQSNQTGASRPVDAPAGMIWIKDVSPVLQQLMVFDGADDLQLLNWNPSTNVVSYPGAVKGPASSNIYNLATWGGDTGSTLLDSGFEIQSSVTDDAPNKVLRSGAFGIGLTSTPASQDLNLMDYTGFSVVYGTEAEAAANHWPSTGLAPTTPVYYAVQMTKNEEGNRYSQTAVECYATVAGVRQWTRTKHDSAWTPWVETWTTDNLKKQPSQYDTTVGALLPVGAFGLGDTYTTLEDANVFEATGFYKISGTAAGAPGSAFLGYNIIQIGKASAFCTQIAFAYAVPDEVWSRTISGGAPTEWKRFAFTTGTAFTGETQFDSIKATGTIKSDGGQVSAADMEAFTATQLNEAGQPLSPTFLIDLENQVTALQAQITALQAQVEALTP